MSQHRTHRRAGAAVAGAGALLLVLWLSLRAGLVVVAFADELRIFTLVVGLTLIAAGLLVAREGGARGRPPA